MKKFYEQDIKDLILEKQHLFVPSEDENTVLFEKAIVTGSTIADCLIFSVSQGIIGVEIKTERDTTKRLNKQLKHYSLVCDKVFVMCHDDHIEKTEVILTKNGHNHVGIISYEEYKGVPIVGVYKQATKSPYKDVHAAYNILWREEIVSILGSFKRQMNTLEELGMKVNSAASRSGGVDGMLKSSSAGKYVRKPELIKAIVNRLGAEEANRFLCRVFANRKQHPSKLLRYYQFKNKE
ncbi:hypothetical protein CPT_Moonbeam151 [Bacillus phage Moonbeam]|uniref:Uncharacterized protein n=1 Tax=Bacillus phage Moonbeam TaxID=1540091 RepID=A0A0A0RPL1_9CAUD|nr:hypothetical protein CPT_Moonbeam151 [Bacillus phage Moonbeam]AIW03549.1 hypothetical protein CPT_Moonbeam151 [Bacillus phage Moonbeam]